VIKLKWIAFQSHSTLELESGTSDPNPTAAAVEGEEEKEQND
jgi:hypothetical protein